MMNAIWIPCLLAKPQPSDEISGIFFACLFFVLFVFFVVKNTTL